MALLKDYLARKLLDEDHPTLDEGRCLSCLRGEGACTVCRSVCPLGVFDGGEPDWSRCDGCGACWAACPSRALRPAALMAGAILEACTRVRGDVVLSCARREGEASLRLPCLAALPWEICAFFALDGRVSLACGACERCPQAPLYRRWLERELPRVRDCLGEDYAERAALCAGEAPPPPGLSRREVFSLLTSKSKATLSSLLPASKDLSPDGSLGRQLLAHRLRQMGETAPACRYLLPAFAPGCTACALCAKLCPGGALHRVEGEEADAEKTWYMAVIPWRCTGCGLCRDACPHGGIRTLEPHWSADPSRPVVYPVSAAVCPRCGEPMEPGESKLCARCQGETGRHVQW